MVQFFAYEFGVPATVILLNLVLFLIFAGKKFGTAKPFREITAAWIFFLKQGIPIPCDYNENEGYRAGVPVLVQPEFRFQETNTVK
ncbi:MAG: hypothetical protein ACE5FY_01570 [Nitrospiria bacterium]